MIKPILAALAQRDVLATVGISTGAVAFVRTIHLEAIVQAAILAATAVFVLSRAALEFRKLIMTARADRAATRNRNRIARANQRRRKKEKEAKQ